MDPLKFSDLRRANVERCENSFHGIDRWTPSDWMTAVAGECGEAANKIKKLRRLETAPDTHRPEDGTAKELTAGVGFELADLVIYADLLAARLGIDLGEAVRKKFDMVSVRVASPVRLPAARR
jgi:NTP pyrophosphatase (non-canonical NTP hydrolase)